MPVPSLPVPLGMRLPWFRVTDVRGRSWDAATLPENRPALVIFLCQHSPYVRHIERHLGETMRELQNDGLTVLAIASNDTRAYPSDALDELRDQALRARFGFPYCLDESQQAAKAFGANCTPELFLFDAERRLVYHGQYDSSRPDNAIPTSGHDIRVAALATLSDDIVAGNQRPSLGCSIKWRAGNEPSYLVA